MRTALIGTTIAGLLLGATACGGDPAKAPPAPQPSQIKAAVVRAKAPTSTPAGSMLSTLGARMLLSTKDIGAHENGSVSPYSIYSALAMTRAGARGTSAQELDRVLGSSEPQQAAAITAIDAQLAKRSGITLSTANGLWPERTLQVRQPFLDRLASGFGAGVYPVDYLHDHQGARKSINQWVSGKTHKLIPELLPADFVSEGTRLVLVNALYLKGSWSTQMTPMSDPQPFMTAGGRSTPTTMMSATSAYPTAAGSGWRSVSMPLKDKRFAMTLIVPDKGRYDSIRSQLGAVVPRALATRSAGSVELSVPSFSVRTAADLKPTLEGFGVHELFDSNRADLSGMAGEPGDLFVSGVVHQSVVKATPGGVEAAAATAAGMAVGSAPQIDRKITVDRAFFFVIHDTATRAPLFLGQVADPSVPTG
ncbi:serpin family protein [Luteipulveratus mongoliensis]|uniref:Serpin domain-containing protein n=1 Tax=Luteipulveratus mongoliensis TaxID=571913 RepID=A0A0K1JI41_9MICO|nr:serpin family protein [Luteipulveratus mongoliensis]AKU16389.1 hypothetical protein VV02_11820 [Luteipulveratus mongoliensis]